MQFSPILLKSENYIMSKKCGFVSFRIHHYACFFGVGIVFNTLVVTFPFLNLKIMLCFTLLDVLLYTLQYCKHKLSWELCQSAKKSTQNDTYYTLKLTDVLII